MGQDPDHANRNQESKTIRDGLISEISSNVGFLIIIPTPVESIQDTIDITCITLLKRECKQKYKVRSNIINEAGRTRDSRSPQARPESSNITRIYDGTILTHEKLTTRRSNTNPVKN